VDDDDDDDDVIMMECAKCGALQEDFDGFGVLDCAERKFCRHPSRHGDGKGGMVRGICGDVESDSCC
jgi:hypothetical protein